MATPTLPRPRRGWPRIIDHALLQEALEMAAAAASEKDPTRQRDLEAEATRLWNEAHGRQR